MSSDDDGPGHRSDRTGSHHDRSNPNSTERRGGPSATAHEPPPIHGSDRDGDTTSPDTPRDWLRWLWRTDRSGVMIVREIVVSVSVVLLIGLILFSISGIWPPMVAIESGSMEPHMSRYDLVFITDTDRFSHEAAVEGTGVVPHDRAAEVGYVKFGDHGDVIVYKPDGANDRVPIIHRAHLWVEEGENWYDRADPNRVGRADDCEELPNCPAPHDGFITLGDANGVYDQVQGQSEPVKVEWIIGTANIRIPYLGWIRLTLSELGIVSVKFQPTAFHPVLH